MQDVPAGICCSFSGGDAGQLLGIAASAGELSETTATETPTPMFVALAPDGDHCYVVHDDAGGEISSISIGSDGELTETARHPTGGAEPCYVSVDAAGEFAFTANYSGGSVSLFPIEADGSLGERAQLIEHEGSGPHPGRQDAAYPHSIVPGPRDRFVYAADLGTDEIWCYELDREAGRLEPAVQPTVEIHEGAGPRHLAFHPNGDLAYLLNELDSTLTVLAIDEGSGALEPLDTLDTLPAELPDDKREASKTADISVHPSGNWLYCSNRGHDSIAIFELDGEGTIERIAIEPVRGEWPRDIELTPDGEHLFVENRHTDEIVTFAVDATDGSLSPTGETLSVTEPVCLAFRGDR
ncbi:lactonase family protein [Salinarchaeum chitinilyticum]